jgi:sialidase-1
MIGMLILASQISIVLNDSTAAEKVKPLMQRQVLFADGQAGYARYRIPSLLVTKRGTVLAFAEGRKKTGRDWDDIDLAMRRSTDGGRTFSDIKFIADQGELTLGNPCPVEDRTTGIIWLLFCRGSKPGRGNAEVLVMKSADDGHTWSKPVDITPSAKDDAWPFVGTGPGHGIQLKNGRLLIPCWADGTQKIGEIQFSFCIYSDDHGATWKRGRALTRNASDECDIVELNDGTIYLNARSRKGKRQRAWAISRDRGHSWSEVRYDAAQPEPSCDGAVLRLTDTYLFKKNRVLVSCPANPKSRDHLTVRLSYDECRSWSVSKLVDAGYSGYSDLAATADKTILCLYETNSVRDITLVRFNIEWLTDEQDSLNPR